MITLRLNAFPALLATAVLILTAAAVNAAPTAEDTTTQSLRLPALFTDHMVLQRDKPCAVWGWAAPGETVTVAVEGLKTTGTAQASAEAGADGKWLCHIGPFSAGGPGRLTVASPAGKRTLQDVLCGEVWICSGQSNMDWQVKQALEPEANIASSSNTQIRLFAVPHRSVPLPLEDIPDAQPWKISGPESVADFSAVAYYFGKEIHERLDVPVGLIKTAAGGTPSESWTSREGLKEFPEFTDRIVDLNAEPADINKAQELFTRRTAEWQQKFDGSDSGYDAAAPAGSEWKWTGADIDTSSWKSLNVPGKWEEQGHGEYDGTVWLRRSVEIPDGATGSDMILHLGRPDDFDETWFNGQRVSSDAGRNARRYKIPADLIKAGENVIAVRVFDAGGVGGFNGSPKDFCLETTGSASASRISIAGEWKMQFGADLAQMPPRPLPPGNWHRPTGLYNGMVAPLVPYAIRGVIWYQGESNASRAWRYRTLFPAMIADWRRLWDQGDFPFLLVQLANFMPRKTEPGEDSWAELREAQLKTLSVPNTGMASAIDIGEADDIHPRNKQEVARRLVLAARSIAYGEDAEWSGPLYERMTGEENAIRLHFTHADGGLTARGDQLKGFAIAGDDRKFVWAEARIDGDTVIVSSPSISKPVAVRYAWEANPESTLYNKEGLPASPFRTDDWPAITRDAR